MIEMTLDEAQALINYLKRQPYEDVAGLINLLVGKAQAAGNHDGDHDVGHSGRDGRRDE